MPRYQRIPPRRPVSWARTLTLWGALATTMVASFAAALWSERLPVAPRASAPAGDFSAARAWPLLSYLADTIGGRLPGSPGAAAARSHLVSRLSTIPGLQVSIQDTMGSTVSRNVLTAYRVRNIVARLPGRQAGSILLTAHYDSPLGSVGAADDAAAVAALVEVARASASGTSPTHSLLFLFDDAEEQGLLGAHAFAESRLADEVRAFVNLESAGNAGKAVLFQGSPGGFWLVDRYAASAPHPYGTVLGQDIFRSGLIPSGTDFEVYQRHRLTGLDVAFYRGGWTYHTGLDQVTAMHPGSMQHMGANTLAVTGALAAGPLPTSTDERASVYYDLLGLTMVRYTGTIATLLAVAAGTLLLLGVNGLSRRDLLRWRALRPALMAGVVGVVAAAATAFAGAALVEVVGGRPLAWFAHPWRGVVAYGALALTGLLAPQWWLAVRAAARDEAPEDRMLAAWTASFLLLLLLLVALTVAGLGSAYLPLWWVSGGAVSLWLLGRRGGRSWMVAAAVGLLPGTLVTVQVGYLAVELFAPIAGRFPPDFPFGFVLAGVSAVIVTLIGLPTLALLHGQGRPAAATVIAGLVALGALGIVWLSFPFSADRPQRLVIGHEEDARGHRITVRSLDATGARRAIASLIPGDGPGFTGTEDSRTMEVVAERTGVAPPTLSLVGERRSASGRTIDLLLHASGAYSTTIQLPDGRAGRWSIHGIRPDSSTSRPFQRLRLVAAPDSGWRFTVEVPGSAPLSLELRSRHDVITPAARELISRLPTWTTAVAEVVIRRDFTF